MAHNGKLGHIKPWTELGARKTVIIEFLGTGRVWVMPVPRVGAPPRG